MKQQPELTVTEQRTDALIPYARNAKIHTNEQVDQICKSIEEFGFNDPIAIWHNANDEMEIVEGHGRVLAASKPGLDAIPTICLDHLTDEQRRAYTHVHNQLNMNTGWNFETLDLDIEELGMSLDLDFEDFGFDFDLDETVNFNSLREMTDDSDEEYQEFVDKFKPKSTTDDCFTPEPVFNAIKDWVCEEYGVDENKIVRPFYPGGDYENYDYPEDYVVLDNPPFSILAQIVDFYIEKNIKFFLFAPFLTLFSLGSRDVCFIPANLKVTYDNGANVSTGFVTNLDDNKIVTSKELYDLVCAANSEETKCLNKYTYSKNVVSSSFFKPMTTIKIPKEETYFIRALDQQKKEGSSIYGAGFLISDKAAKAKAEAEAEAEAKVVWVLSDAEKEIINKLNEAAGAIRL